MIGKIRIRRMHGDWSIGVEIKQECLNHVNHLGSACRKDGNLVMGDDDPVVATKTRMKIIDEQTTIQII